MEALEKHVLESDAEKLIEAAKFHAGSPEGKELKGEDLMRRAIQTVAQTDKGSVGSTNDDVAQNPLTNYALSESLQVKQRIENLLQLAAKEGIVKATAEASKASPFVLDAFHDALAAKLYPYLKEKGLLK